MIRPVDAGDLFYVARRLKAHADDALGAGEGQADALPTAHQLVLGLVLSSPRSSIKEIATNLALPQSAVSGAVASLRDAQLLVTEVDDDDRRVTRVSAAPRLAAWAAKHLKADAASVLEPLLIGCSRSERRCVLDGLAILHDAFKRMDELPARAARKAR